VGGGISAGIIIFRDLPESRLKLFSLMIITALMLVGPMYFLYSYIVDRPKISVLKGIENKLGLIGAYGHSEGRSNIMFWIALSVILVGYFLFIVILFGRFSMQISS
jgi:hypothetical protein